MNIRDMMRDLPHHKVPPFDRDQFLLLPRDRAATAAQQAMTALHLLPAHEQMAAISLLFAVYTRWFHLDPEETYHYGRKLQRPEQFHRKGNAQVEALEALAGLHEKGNFT